MTAHDAAMAGPEPLRLGSMFAGYGGLDLAIESVFGARTVWQAEWEDAPSAVLARHWPGVPNLRDVTTVDWAQVEPVDIIAGGFPCQDVSLAGRRAGMTEGTRSNLWGAMRSAVEIIRPAYVVAENVRGLLSAHAESASDMEPGPGLLGDRSGGHLRALGRVLGDLADLGYDTQWCGLRASDVGAPHHRFRIFILATRATDRDGIRSDRPRAPRLEEGRSEPANRGERPADAPGNTRRVLDGDRRAADWGPHAPLGGPPAPDADDIGCEGAGAGRPDAEHPAAAGGDGPAPDAYGYGRSLVGRVDPEQRHADGRSGPHPHGDRPESATRTDWGPYAAAVHRWEPIVGRRAPAPTELTERGKHRLSPRFTEFMMGLPDGWVTDTPGITRNDALKMCGNGVVPQQAAEALNHMLTAAKGTP